MKTCAKYIRAPLFLLLWGGVVAGLIIWLLDSPFQPQPPRIIGAVGKDSVWQVVRPGSGSMEENGWVFEVRDRSGQPYELPVRYALLLDREMDEKNYSVIAAMKVAALDKGQITGLMLFKNTQDFQIIWLSGGRQGLVARYGGTAGVSFGPWEANALAGGEDGRFLAILRLEQEDPHCRAYVLDADSSWVQIGDAVSTGGHGYRPVLFASKDDIVVDFRRFRIKLPVSGKGGEQ